MGFEKIYIEISDICGLKCGFCPAKKGVRGEMSIDEFRIIAKKLQKKAKIYTFHLLGDPLKSENLNEFMNVSAAFKMPVELTTSGFYMDEKNQKILLNALNLRQVNFSLMAFLSQKSVNLNEYFKPIFAYLDSFLTQNKDNFVNFRLWNLNKNLTPPKENEQIYELLQEKFRLKINKNSQKIRLANRIFLQQKPQFKWTTLSGENTHKKGFCYALSRQIAILSDGTLTPCCMDASGVIALGNLFRQDLGEILQNERARAMKAGFERGELVEKLCQGCEFGRSQSMRDMRNL